MAKLKLYLDKRRTSAAGLYPLRIGITTRAAHLYLTTDIRLQAENWDDRAGCVVRSPYRVSMNKTINELVMRVQDILSRNAGDVDVMTAAQLREFLDRAMNGDDGEMLAEYFQRFGEARKAPGTRKIYRRVYGKLRAALPGFFAMRVCDLTYQHIKNVIDYLEENGTGRNTTALYLNCISAVLNDALDAGIITASPMTKIHYKRQETRKRAVSLDTIRALAERDDLTGWQAVARDMFLLSFFLVGINCVDLLKARCSDVHDGRLEYTRSKTGKLYSILITPEARAIIDRYTDGDSLVRLPSNAVNYDSIITQVTASLQQIQPGLTYYVARHSWASIAYDIGVPLDVISDSLGHSHGAAVTGVYIKKSLARIDKAQRIVTDALLGKVKDLGNGDAVSGAEF